MKESEAPKRGGKAKKFFIFAILTAIGTAIATIFVKRKKEQEKE